LEVLYCTRTISGPCPTLQLLSLPVRFRFEEFFAGECKYGNDIPSIPFYFPLLPRTLRLNLPRAFFHSALFFAVVFIIYLFTLFRYSFFSKVWAILVDI
jgi:hypothetical protein